MTIRVFLLNGHELLQVKGCEYSLDALLGGNRALTAAFAEHGQSIAAVISEAAPANMGTVAPPMGFNRLIATLCRNEGAVFIVDEVLITASVEEGGGRELLAVSDDHDLLAPGDGPPALEGALFHVDALKAYNRALAATAAEEHS